MESTRFDALTRRLASGATRRGALAGLAAAFTRLLPSTIAAQPNPPCRPIGGRCVPERRLDCCPGTTCRGGRCRCPQGKRRCRGECLDVRRCCGGQCPGGAVCQEGRCVCPSGTKRCQGRCIPQRARCSCPAGTKRCGQRCIARQACCRNQECGPGQECAGGRCRCRPGNCCIETTAELHAALAPGGPATIRLCPNTTYRGGFSITRTVTIIGAGATSSILDGGGTQRVVEIQDPGTQVELRELGISNGRSTGGGILNSGQLTLTDAAVVGNTAPGGSGGGLANILGGTATLTQCRIATNAASLGAGIVNTGQLSLVDCDLTGNVSSLQGGGLYNFNEATLDNSRLTGNTAYLQGGGIVNFDGQLTLQNGTVVGGTLPAQANQAPSGGGIYTVGAGSSLGLTASHVIGNIATGVAVGVAVGGIERSASAPTPTIGAGSSVVNNQPCDCNFAGCATTCA